MPVPCLVSNLLLANNSIAGIKNANVLPEPVLAAPNKSRPFNKWGIHLD